MVRSWHLGYADRDSAVRSVLFTMGFFLSLLYFITYYLTPTLIFGPLAQFRVELILATLVVIVSLPRLGKSFVRKTPQSLALVGLTAAVVMSVLVGEQWAGGGVDALLFFIPSGFAYFLVCLHCDSRKRLQILVLMLLSVCLFVIAQGVLDLRHVVPDSFSAQPETGSLYLLPQGVGKGEWIYRLRGLGEINDPNDLGQLIACVIPLVFIFWRKKKFMRNVAFVLCPVTALLFGIFMTHSRGAMLAVLAMAIVAARRRIGTVPSMVLGAGMFAGAMALNFTGGRDVSVGAGADRTALWGTGLEIFKSHPLFGVGFNNFADYAGLTAHNSLVVCAAELGLFGLYFWTMFLLPTVRDALVVASPERVIADASAGSQNVTSPQAARKIEVIDKAEINDLGRLMVLSLTGFLVAGWFLSRSFVTTLFLLGGMAEVVFELGLRRGMVMSRMTLGRVTLNTIGLAVVLIAVMYGVLRTVHLMR